MVQWEPRDHSERQVQQEQPDRWVELDRWVEPDPLGVPREQPERRDWWDQPEDQLALPVKLEPLVTLVGREAPVSDFPDRLVLQEPLEIWDSRGRRERLGLRGLREWPVPRVLKDDRVCRVFRDQPEVPRVQPDPLGPVGRLVAHPEPRVKRELQDCLVAQVPRALQDLVSRVALGQQEI